MTTTNRDTVKSLTKQLSSVAKQAKSLGIDTRKAESMIRQTKAEGGKAYKGSTYESEYNELVKPIPVADIKNQKPVDLPTPPVPADLTGMLTGNNAGLGAGADGMFDTTKTPESADPYADIFKFTMDSLTSAQKELGNSEDRYAKLEKKNDLPELRRDVKNYQSQLNSIVAEANANKLKLEGQGRGIPDVVIGGQQAQIEREAAIRALPVQAQLAAAQGNLEIAQAHVDRLFTLQTEDAKNRYNFKVQAIQAVSQYATDTQNRKLEELRRKEDRAWELQKINMSDLRTLANTAIEYGQSSLAGQIMRLDPTSPTFANDYANLQARVTRPVTPKAPDLQNFGTADNPIWKQYNAATGTWVDVSGISPQGTASDPQKQTEAIAKLDKLLGYVGDAKTLTKAAGPSAITRVLGDTFIGDTKFRQLENVIDTLKVNLLTMNTDPAVKKFFGPQMSNRDTELMTSAGSTLNAQRQTPTQMGLELASYEDLVKRAKGWTILGSGQNLTVTLTDPATKKSVRAVVSYETLSQAIKDGVQVTF